MGSKFYCWKVLTLLFFVSSSVVFAQGEPNSTSQAAVETKYGVGFQSSFPAYGISGMVDANDALSAQGIIGFFGNLKTFAGRGLYRFRKESNWNIYGYGMTGAWSYTGFRVGEAFAIEETTETVLGFGAGAGIEYDWRAWNAELPPVVWNLELGVGVVDFDQVNYNFSTLLLGAGVHYRF